MDARQRRSQRLLYAAVLDLAAAQPVPELTVTAVAAAAGVQRSTFYAHADSPTDLLRAALLAELDTLRAGLLDDPARDTAASVAEVTRGVLEHVRDHAAIYRRGLADDAGSASLHGMLSEHFLGSSRVLLRQGRLALPAVPGLPTELADDAATRFVAQGTVGVITAWLASPDPLSTDVFTALYAVLVPTWWVQQAEALVR